MKSAYKQMRIDRRKKNIYQATDAELALLDEKMRTLLSAHNIDHSGTKGWWIIRITFILSGILWIALNEWVVVHGNSLSNSLTTFEYIAAGICFASGILLYLYHLITCLRIHDGLPRKGKKEYGMVRIVGLLFIPFGSWYIHILAFKKLRFWMRLQGLNRGVGGSMYVVSVCLSSIGYLIVQLQALSYGRWFLGFSVVFYIVSIVETQKAIHSMAKWKRMRPVVRADNTTTERIKRGEGHTTDDQSRIDKTVVDCEVPPISRTQWILSAIVVALFTLIGIMHMG